MMPPDTFVHWIQGQAVAALVLATISVIATLYFLLLILLIELNIKR